MSEFPSSLAQYGNFVRMTFYRSYYDMNSFCGSGKAFTKLVYGICRTTTNTRGIDGSRIDRHGGRTQVDFVE